MLTYNHISNVSLNLIIKHNLDVNLNFISKFGIGNSLYVKEKANMGKLEKITIRRIHFFDNGYVKNYVDTYNRVWMENEIIEKNKAIELAISYYEKINNILKTK